MLREEIFGSPGYSADCRLAPAELEFLRKTVADLVLDRACTAFEDAGLTDYHKVTHELLWGSKAHRLLPFHVVQSIKAFKFLKRVREEIGDWRLSPVVVNGKVKPGSEEAYFRIVRPGRQEDVGKLHVDRDYHLINGRRMFLDDEITAKCWIPVECERGLSGLMMETDGQPPFVLHSEAGQVVIFNDSVPHVGYISQETKTRVSVEITLVFKK